MLTWKRRDQPTCNWSDDCLLGPNHHDPRLQPNSKVIFVLKHQFQSYKKRRPTTHLCQATPCHAHQNSSASMPCLQHGKRYMHSQHDNHQILIFMYSRGTNVTFDNKPFKLSNVQLYKEDKPVPLQSSKFLHKADFLTLTFDTQKNSVKASALATDVPPLQHSAPSWQ